MWIWGPERPLIESLLQHLTPDRVDSRTDRHLKNGGEVNSISESGGDNEKKSSPRGDGPACQQRGFSFLWDCVSYFWYRAGSLSGCPGKKKI